MDTTALLSRIANGRTDLVFELATGTVDVSGLQVDDASVLQWCAYYGDVSALRLLLARGARLDALGADLGLNAAAFHGHWQLCQFLLEHGAPVEGANGVSGETPLHSALCSHDRVRHDAVVRVLLAAGADPNARTIPGIETGAWMRDCRTRGETPLHRAAACGTEATIRLLLEAGARIDARDAHQDSALGWASLHRRPVAILRLLCFGPFRIHEDYRGMAQNLCGDPQPPAPDRAPD